MAKEFILPPALEKGEKVAIVGTSGGVQEFPEVLEKGIDTKTARN